MRAALSGLDEGTFTEGHELDRKWQVPKSMVGRRLCRRKHAEITNFIAEFPNLKKQALRMRENS